MMFGSVCSGIEAASVAWEPLGWRAAWFSEIEPFPSAVLAHHYPDVQNLGDMSRLPGLIRSGDVPAPDVFCGGTPCQAFSVAGLRRSLDDKRGNLSLTFVEIANAIDDVRRARNEPETVVFWENVPGVLSTRDNAFGCFLGALAGCDTAIVPLAATGWTDAGLVAGPGRAVAWRTLDAQYFGLAQRRKRVFVVASARDGFDPATVLFEWEGVRRDSAPSRETREETAPSIVPGVAGSLDTECGGGKLTHQSVRAQDVEAGALLPVTHSLRAEGFDASEDGTGRGTPLVPVVAPTMDQRAGRSGANSFATSGGLVPVQFSAQMSVPQVDVDICQTLGAKNPQAVAFSAKDYGGDATADLAPTLRAMSHDGSHANGGGQLAVAFAQNQRDEVRTMEVAGALAAESGAKQQTYLAQPVAVDVYNQSIDGDIAATLNAESGAPNHSGPKLLQHMQVRRLTPVECSRLQGFPDDYLELKYANATQAHAAQVLHELWRTVASFAREGWRPGIAASLLTPQILLAGVYGGWVSWALAAECAAARRKVQSAHGWPEGFVQALRINTQLGSSPYRRESFEQCARELGGHLPRLSYERAQAEAALLNSELWPDAQRAWPLRYALATASQAEKGVLTPDGPRYKALGNSWAVPVVRWIGARIDRALRGRPG